MTKADDLIKKSKAATEAYLKSKPKQLEFNDGVHLISNEEYHSSKGVSRSGLMKLQRSPAHFWHEYLNPDFVKKEPTPDMIMGSLVHTVVLEPDLFSNEYIIRPEFDVMPPTLLLKDVGRELYDENKAQREAIKLANDILLDEFEKQAKGKRIVSQDMMKQAHDMCTAVFKDDTANSLFNGAKVEHSIYFTHKETGLKVKARPDAWLGSIVTDLKTTRDASYKAFQRDAYTGGYFLQAGLMYKALESINITMDKFVFFCVEKTEPYLTATYILDDAALDYGVNLFDDLMAKYAECLRADEWPGYPMQTLTVPGWAKFDEVI